MSDNTNKLFAQAHTGLGIHAAVDYQGLAPELESTMRKSRIPAQSQQVGSSQ